MLPEENKRTANDVMASFEEFGKFTTLQIHKQIKEKSGFSSKRSQTNTEPTSTKNRNGIWKRSAK